MSTINPIPIFYDLETFWAPGYSLSTMNPFAYMADERFAFVSVDIIIGHEHYSAFGHDETVALLRRMPWHKGYAIAHNGNAFDHLILAYKLGIRAARYGDTLCMARPHFDQLSLGALVERFGLGKKDNRVLMATKGKYAHQFTQSERECMLRYNSEDTAQLKMLFCALLAITSGKELKTIDMTAKKACHPTLVFDMPMLRAALEQVAEDKEAVLRTLYPILGTDNLDDTRGALMSNPKFAVALEALGVTPPTKTSLKTGKEAFAFAKTDAGFLELLEHDDPRVQTVAGARLNAKSTLLESRLETMIQIGDMTPQHWCPITLAYYGAKQTGRLSGFVWNPQNLPRIGKKPSPTDALRMSIMAPDGKMVVVRDLSGIELRTNMALSGQWDQVALLRQGEDLYLVFAGEHLYHMKLDKDIHKAERGVGKLAHLSLGYSAGGDTFGNMARIQKVNLDMLPAVIVRTYRTAMSEVVANWKRLGNAIPSMLLGERRCVDSCGLIYTDHEALVLPSGRKIRYPGLRKDGREWLFDGYKGRAKFDKRVYGGLMAENCLAAGADVLTARGWVAIERVTSSDMVYDGSEWVACRGAKYMGDKPTIDFGGVRLTADHPVLVDGWVAAGETSYAGATSSFRRHYGPTIRLPDGDELRWEQREEVPVVGDLRLRGSAESASRRAAQGDYYVLRVPSQKASGRTTSDARHVAAPGVRSMEGNAGAVQQPEAQSLEELRRAWGGSMPAVGDVRAVLVGHGADVPVWAGAGQDGQQQGVHAGELPVGHAGAELEQQTAHGNGGSAERGDYASVHSSEDVWGGSVDVVLPDSHRQDGRSTVHPAEPVYDILNAGPLHRFVVRGTDGLPFIVHNCSQAIARDVINDHALEVNEDTQVAHIVHDEIICVTDEGDAPDLLDWMGEVMGRPLDWWPELPLASEGSYGRRYGEAK